VSHPVLSRSNTKEQAWNSHIRVG